MIKYTCRKMTKDEIKNIENFQMLPQLNVRSAVTDLPTVKKLMKTKCPDAYSKIGDICCPVYLEKGKCPANDPKDKTRIKGMPICALNYVASNDWAKKNKSKLLKLCTELPKVTPAVKRKNTKVVCGKGLELIYEECYKPCPPGFKSEDTYCVPEKFNRGEGVTPICPPKTVKLKNKCYNECPFGFKPFDDYCVPNDLADF